jgi:hypothetical protein
MEHKPITRQRSPWTQAGSPIPGVVAYYRRVSDGTLRALVANEPAGWQLSISFVDHRGRASRYPQWDEIFHARRHLFPADLAFVMHLPTDHEYVAVHDSTFHLHQLHQHPERPRP